MSTLEEWPGLNIASTRIREARVGPSDSVTFTHDHHIDSKESATAGKYDFHYEYDVFRFSDGDCALVARSYSDEPDSVSFVGIDTKAGEELITEATFRTALFQIAAKHLRSLGKGKLYWLSENSADGTYAPIPERSVDAP